MTIKILHPGAKWSFRIRGYFSGLFLLIFLTGIIVFPMSANSDLNWTLITLIFLSYLVAIILFVEIFSRLSYNNWKYEFTEDTLKIEKGIIWKKYTSIPYERVQNVDLHRGVIARMLGFSVVNVQTAGASFVQGGRDAISEGFIPGVSKEEAEKIRDFLTKKISGKKSKQGF